MSQRTKTQTPSRRQTNYIQDGYNILRCTEFAFCQIHYIVVWLKKGINIPL